MRKTMTLLVWFCMSMLALPAFATADTMMLLPAAAYTAPEKAMTTAAITSTADQAQHATASASASRLCASGPTGGDPDYDSPAPLIALGVGHAHLVSFAMRDPGDESDSTDNPDGIVAGIGGDDDGERMPLAA